MLIRSEQTLSGWVTSNYHVSFVAVMTSQMSCDLGWLVSWLVILGLTALIDRLPNSSRILCNPSSLVPQQSSCHGIAYVPSLYTLYLSDMLRQGKHAGLGSRGLKIVDS